MSESRTDAQRNNDSPIDDVRQIRERLSNRFGNDVRKLGEYVRHIGETTGRELGCAVVHKTTEPTHAATDA